MTVWLPLISSLVVATVTLIGIRINNRTNRAAIAAADEREYRKWQREMILRQCSEVIETATAAHDMYWRAFDDPLITAAQLKSMTDEYMNKISTNVAVLKMLNAPTISASCSTVIDVLAELWESTEDDDWNSGLTHTIDRLKASYGEVAQVASVEIHQLSLSIKADLTRPIRQRLGRFHRSKGNPTSRRLGRLIGGSAAGPPHEV
ncbi:hypothetical protein GPX89_19850 [Nocardia sp. ET3-3]|uniref:DUF4760 domain-containing protein n=1 Tax=Nocardia terrae TaxID=2675851 RepID=A0A7K1UZ94_9NOCA|nr:hypothetical protein [Nocardia terrae]MVU79489.1 hypothetical protein [Nocardia terrae]